MGGQKLTLDRSFFLLEGSVISGPEDCVVLLLEDWLCRVRAVFTENKPKLDADSFQDGQEGNRVKRGGISVSKYYSSLPIVEGQYWASVFVSASALEIGIMT